jgi:hypothetical protein
MGLALQVIMFLLEYYRMHLKDFSLKRKLEFILNFIIKIVKIFFLKTIIKTTIITLNNSM